MSQKTERPVLSGQRIKTRKRDEREKYDPTGFRDAVIAGLEKAEGDLEQISKYLDTAGNKLDYRRYGEVLFDILIAGGLLVPGGSISQDGEKPQANCCLFTAPEDMQSMRNYEQVFVKLMRRYKYLEKMFEEEMKKVLLFIRGFTPSERIKLARMTALWIGNGAVPPSVLLVLNTENLIKDGIALEFLVELCVTFKQEKGLSSLTQALKKGGLESKLMEFFPLNKRTEENFKAVFLEKGLTEIVKLHKAQASQEAKRELQQTLLDDINDNKSHKEIIADIKELAQKTIIPEHEVICLIWATVMSLAEWNKKEELVTDQAVKHLKGYTQLLQAFTTSDKAESSLILKVQEFCYENMIFMKAFQKIILLFYRTEVVSEESIVKWYKEGHSSKGKMHFLEQMKKFIEWLQNAEEDETEKYDPTGFRDAVIAGLEKAEGDLEQISKYLDTAGNKLDYRRYGEVLFDILIAGGLLVPGGSISQDGEKPQANYCLFTAPEDMPSMRNYEQVFVKLIRRYKYLEKMFEEEVKKVLLFIRGFTPSERMKLARMTALWIGNGAVPPSVLLVLNTENLIEDGIALEFLVELCVTFKQEKGLSSLTQALTKGGLESKLMEFFPLNKRTEENFKAVFLDKGLTEIVKLHTAQASQEAKRELQQTLLDDINDNKSHKEIIADIKELAQKTIIPEHEVICLIWATVMSLAEWNKKEELVTDQAVKHLKGYTELLKAFTTSDKAESSLILIVQEFCYENVIFMKAFQKIILLFYRTEVVSEESIVKWYKEGHSSKGKLHFLEQTKKFIEWLQNAEEESESEED